MKKLYVLIIGLMVLGMGMGFAQFRILYNFNSTYPNNYGANPYGDATVSGNKLYGITEGGGFYVYGNIFSMNTDGSGFKDLYDLHNGNGTYPYGSLILSAGKLYGMTSDYGTGHGTIFSIDTDGNGFKVLHYFNGTDGAYPRGSLLIMGGALFGMTEQGGVYSDGNIFSIDTNGTGFRDLFDFDGTNGASPQASLICVSGVFYGMTLNGATSYGNIFSIDTNGTGFKDLHEFTISNWAPYGSLTYTNGELYGMVQRGGIDFAGSIFSIDTNGSKYKNLFDFNDTDGLAPYGSLTYSGGVLYGMTSGGGIGNNSYGVIFSIDTNGRNFTDLFDFVSDSGAYPRGDLMLSGDGFYGMATFGGGIYSYGDVFRLNTCTLSSSITSTINVTCNGGNNGSATVTPSAGNPPYTYLWSPGGVTDSTASGLSAGTYTVTVIDSNGCINTDSVTITQPEAIGINLTTTPGNSCNMFYYGSATVDSTWGGTPPYTYTWPDRTHGTYWHYARIALDSVLVTDSNGCTAYFKFTIANSAYVPVIDSVVVTSVLPDSGSNTGEACFQIYATGASTYFLLNFGPPFYTNTYCLSNLTGGDTACLIIEAVDGTFCLSPSDTTCVYIPTKVITGGGKTSTSYSNSFNVYPNPSKGIFTVQSSRLSGQSTIEIYNVLGEKVYSKLSSVTSKLSIDLSSQPSGVYFYRILTMGGGLLDDGKLVIEK